MDIFKLVKGHILSVCNLLVITYVTVTLLWKKKRKMLALQRQSCGNNRESNVTVALC